MQTDNYLTRLAEWYCEERKKLEELSIFKRESQIKFKKQIDIIESSIEQELEVKKLKEKYKNFSRGDIFGEIESISLFNALSDLWAYRERKRVDLEAIPDEKYLHEIAKYFYQMELVNGIGQVLIDKHLDPEKIFSEYCRKIND